MTTRYRFGPLESNGLCEARCGGCTAIVTTCPLGRISAPPGAKSLAMRACGTLPFSAIPDADAVGAAARAWTERTE